MWLVSDRFMDAVAGSHESITRMRLLDRSSIPQYGTNPIGVDIPIIDGNVTMSLIGDVKRSLSVTVPGDWWDRVQPYGQELFVERGIDFGDGTTEMVPLGYFRINSVSQESAPDGVVDVEAQDRICRLIENRVKFPTQIPDGTTHRAVFDGLINGALFNSFDTYWFKPNIPIVFTAYDPDAFTVSGGQVVEDSSYDVLVELATNRDAVLRFRATGELEVGPREGQVSGEKVVTIRGGPGGTLVRASRATTREGVYNSVAASTSDPAIGTSRAWQAFGDQASPLYFAGPFGTVTRYFASPLLRNVGDASTAATTVLSRYRGLPIAVDLEVVPNPATEPGDPFSLDLGSLSGVYQVETIGMPLSGSSPMKITTRTLNAAL